MPSSDLIEALACVPTRTAIRPPRRPRFSSDQYFPGHRFQLHDQMTERPPDADHLLVGCSMCKSAIKPALSTIDGPRIPEELNNDQLIARRPGVVDERVAKPPVRMRILIRTIREAGQVLRDRLQNGTGITTPASCSAQSNAL